MRSLQTDVSLQKLPPHSLEYEESILVACFFDSKNLPDILDSLKPDHFYRTAHQIIFQAIQEVAKSEAVQAATVVQNLRDNNKLEQIGGVTYIGKLLEFPLATKPDTYCRKIKEKAALRRMIEKAQGIINAGYEETGTTEEIINQAQKDILDIEIDTRVEAISLSELTDTSSDRYEELYKNKGKMSGLRTGFMSLDILTSGLQNSDLIVLAARPSMGKTSIALNITSEIGKTGTPTGWFSLEMSKDQINDRIVAGESGVNSLRFRDGNFSQSDWEKIHHAQSRLHEWPVYIDDSEGLSVMEIRRRARRMVKKYGCKVFFIDHLQLVKGDDKRTRNEEVSSITAGLKGMAKELNLPVVLISQLNRSLEQRPNKRPILSDLRDSGTIEQDADIVMFLYRREPYKDWYNFKFQDVVYKSEPDHIENDLLTVFGQSAELNLSKHRSGPTGMIRLAWQKKQTRFYSVKI